MKKKKSNQFYQQEHNCRLKEVAKEVVRLEKLRAEYKLQGSSELKDVEDKIEKLIESLPMEDVFYIDNYIMKKKLLDNEKKI